MQVQTEHPSCSITGFESYLLDRAALTAADIARAHRAVEASGGDLLSGLTDLGIVADDRLIEYLSDYTGLEILSNLTADHERALKLGLPFLGHACIIPLADKAQSTDTYQIAVANPFNEFAIQGCQIALKRPVSLVLSTKTSIEKAHEELQMAASGEELSSSAEAPSLSADDTEVLRDKASAAPVVKLINRLFEESVSRGATDIHFETTRQGLAVRYRIDGILLDGTTVGPDTGPALFSRLKLLAGLDIAENRLPQDGRIRSIIAGNTIDMRLATLPGLFGENAVVRILDKSRVHLDLSVLGYAAAAKERLADMIGQTSGLVLITGPTGSGKTTTLYALLNQLKSRERKIVTVEDPVEYEFDGMTQIQVKPQIGLTFARVLRAALRHDPDVLLVGEIRDKETAQVAIEASLTGHLVLATLHTNSACAAPARLVDMGIENYLVATALSGVVAQRLVRTLCSHCKKPDIVSSPRNDDLEPNLFTPVGCDHCNGTGYRGRTTIYEILVCGPAIQKGVMEQVDSSSIEQIALTDGFASMQACGRQKAHAGKVALADVLLATGGNQ